MLCVIRTQIRRGLVSSNSKRLMKFSNIEIRLNYLFNTRTVVQDYRFLTRRGKRPDITVAKPTNEKDFLNDIGFERIIMLIPSKKIRRDKKASNEPSGTMPSGYPTRKILVFQTLELG